jgi:hypothetical protein
MGMGMARAMGMVFKRATRSLFGYFYLRDSMDYKIKDKNGKYLLAKP